MRIFGHALGHADLALENRHEIEVRVTPQPVFGATFFQRIAECGRCSLLVIDALSETQAIVYASPAVEELTGYPPDELIGQDWRQFLIRSGAPSRADVMAGAARGGSIACESVTIRHRNGVELCLEVKLSQLGADPAFITHYIAILQRLANLTLDAAKVCREPLAA